MPQYGWATYAARCVKQQQESPFKRHLLLSIYSARFVLPGKAARYH